jgi:hypothetical protein
MSRHENIFECPVCSTEYYSPGAVAIHCEVCEDKNEDALYVQTTDYLISKGLSWESRKSACMLIIQHPTKTSQRYAYQYTTGRWANLVKGKNKTRKHYRSKGIKDFVERFVMS